MQCRLLHLLLGVLRIFGTLIELNRIQAHDRSGCPYSKVYRGSNSRKSHVTVFGTILLVFRKSRTPNCKWSCLDVGSMIMIIVMDDDDDDGLMVNSCL